jgi:uncharacterized protein
MYSFIGKALLFAAFFSIFISIIALIVSRISLNRKVWLAGFFSNVLDFFYLPIKYFFYKFSDPRILDKWMVSLKNIAHAPDFSKTKKRIIVVPHCVRSLDCPAPSTIFGIQCQNCGKCILTQLRKDAEQHGYLLYIFTGSSAVTNILKHNPADGILAIACDYEINKGMRALNGEKIVTFGIPLLNDGCYNTKVDYKKVIDTIEYFDKNKM